MLTINAITVRLGGRAILDRASASITPGSKVGLIGRNGAGKSTLMKVIVGQLEADEGEIEMPRRTRLGYIAQEAPSGTTTPFEAVLAADTERRAILDREVSCRLDSEPISSRCFTPLPVLGVPGWWPENEAHSFYDDPQVFRPGRRRNGP